MSTWPAVVLGLVLTLSSVSVADAVNLVDRPGRFDTRAVLVTLDAPRGVYQVSLTNQSGLPWLKTVTWAPPAGMVIREITRSTGARCRLAAGVVTCTVAGKGLLA